MAPPISEEPLTSMYSGAQKMISKQTGCSNNIFLSEIQTIKNNLNKTVISDSFEVHQNIVAKPNNQSDQITNNGTMSISSGDTCSISNFSGSNSRLSNNSGCSISSDEHEGIWRKLEGKFKKRYPYSWPENILRTDRAVLNYIVKFVLFLKQYS